MSLNDTSMHPTGVEAVYPGVANPTPSNGLTISDVPSSDSQADKPAPEAPKKDTIEGKPGVIESTELAPLGDGKVAADPGLVTQATILGKKAYEAVVGSSE
ncbi:hypothetical protein DB88DRAFT_540208 [Papiliotrema laurentii]|uniref:Uncharacterized protein n=1 Tax=Papiliotrema laurentii TaxID=5418 RepID=A0AAD9D0I6_PAPLA|nr:hypothetical protein DB88DRAFT_540208 [Papiliotrema laurentii]